MSELNHIPQQSRRTFLDQGLLAILASALPGCAMGVMFGKMIGGDPTITADFKTQTKEDLTKGKSTVLVVCKAPDSVDSENSTLAYDLIEGITRKLKLHGVKVVSPDDVSGWIDENGMSHVHPVRLARDFDTDYVIFVEIHSFSFREPNSPKLLRGRASGFIRTFEINEVGGHPQANTVFVSEFKSTFPEHQPVSEQGRSSLIFQEEYKDRICTTLAEKFYDHRPGSGI